VHRYYLHLEIHDDKPNLISGEGYRVFEYYLHTEIKQDLDELIKYFGDIIKQAVKSRGVKT